VSETAPCVGRSNVAPARTFAPGPRMSLHSRGEPRVAPQQPIFTPGDLVWYQHPSGPWIAGRVVGLELHSRVPVYVIVTIEDGVRRVAQEPKLRLRTSSQLPEGDFHDSWCCNVLKHITVCKSLIPNLLLTSPSPRATSAHSAAHYATAQ
jgi:hypothetical protein